MDFFPSIYPPLTQAPTYAYPTYSYQTMTTPTLCYDDVHVFPCPHCDKCKCGAATVKRAKKKT